LQRWLDYTETVAQDDLMRSLGTLSRKHKAEVLLGIVLLVFVAVSAVVGSRGWFHLRRLEREQAQMEALAVGLERQNESVEEHLRRLDNDDAYLEKVVRERIGWVKPNEMLYRSGGVGAGESGGRDVDDTAGDRGN
jgi:cell division protein FtsB